MKRVKYVLDHKDRELLQRFQISKEVQIKLVKFQENVNNKTAQKISLMFPPSCDISSKNFGNPDLVNCAEEVHKLYKCHMCPYSSAIKHHQTWHSRTHLAYKRFKCDKCSYGTNYKNNLQRHTLSQHNQNPERRKRNYPCQLCSKSFFTISALRVHLSVHTKEKPFPCQFCCTSFTLKASKNRHEIVCTQNPKGSDPVCVESHKRFQCKLCGTKFLTKGALTVHIRYHTQERPYKCNQCDFAGVTASVLKHHVERRHNQTKIKNFECELCQKLFLTNGELYQHIHTHTKETLSACRFCKKQFGTKFHGNRHQIICKSNPKQNDEEWVRKNKKFKCEFCNYSSTQKINLQRHLKRHMS